jgi:hypothetical protein
LIRFIGHRESCFFGVTGFPAGHGRAMFSSRANGGVFRRRSGTTASRVSAKFMLERELTGLRYSYEEAVPIV